MAQIDDVTRHQNLKKNLFPILLKVGRHKHIYIADIKKKDTLQIISKPCYLMCLCVCVCFVFVFVFLFCLVLFCFFVLFLFLFFHQKVKFRQLHDKKYLRVLLRDAKS